MYLLQTSGPYFQLVGFLVIHRIRSRVLASSGIRSHEGWSSDPELLPLTQLQSDRSPLPHP